MLGSLGYIEKAEYETVVLKPTEQQKEIVESLGERAEVVRNGGVDASVDNMLKITNDGRKLALDQRLVNELLPDNPESKISVCAEKSYEIWKGTAAQKSAQLIFGKKSGRCSEPGRFRRCRGFAG